MKPWLAAVVVLLCLITSGAQPLSGPASSILRHADLSVDVSLVVVPVHVTTPLGVSVTGLQKNGFHVFEDGVQQTITHFSSEDAPVSAGLLFDLSGSMRNKMSKSLEAAAELLKTANLDDEFFLVEFNNRPTLTVPLTRNMEDISRRLVQMKPVGKTSLFDAIHMALLHMKTAHSLRKAIVILSDGGDNHSRYTETEIREALREADVQIYAIGIFESSGWTKLSKEEREGPQLLAQLAIESGGKHFPVENLDKLPGICAQIGYELHNQYMLGYSPTSGANDGHYRKLKVTLDTPDGMPTLRVRYRQGYIPR